MQRSVLEWTNLQQLQLNWESRDTGKARSSLHKSSPQWWSRGTTQMTAEPSGSGCSFTGSKGAKTTNGVYERENRQKPIRIQDWSDSFKSSVLLQQSARSISIKFFSGTFTPKCSSSTCRIYSLKRCDCTQWFKLDACKVSYKTSIVWYKTIHYGCGYSPAKNEAHLLLLICFMFIGWSLIGQ